MSVEYTRGKRDRKNRYIELNSIKEAMGALEKQGSVSFLNEAEKKCCLSKYSEYKALGSEGISKEEIRKLLVEFGKRPSEEDLLEMMILADPKGRGILDYASFEKVIEDYKVQRETDIGSVLGPSPPRRPGFRRTAQDQPVAQEGRLPRRYRVEPLPRLRPRQLRHRNQSQQLQVRKGAPQTHQQS